MINVVKDDSFVEGGRHFAMLEVRYPERSEWNMTAFEAFRDSELEKIKAGAAGYSRDKIFRQDPFFRYFRKYKKTFPVMMQVESFLLKDRPFGNDDPINQVAFLTELKLRGLVGTHDVDRMQGDITIYCPAQKEPFSGMHGQGTHVYPGDVTLKDDIGPFASMIAGADDRTCLGGGSLHVAYLIFGTPSHDAGLYESTKEQLEEYIETLAPGAAVEYKFF